MTMLLQGVVGSTAYGLNHAKSDKDFLGVEVYPTSDFLGMYPRRSDSDVGKDADGNDRTVHEVGKYMGLAAKANPTASELLWLDEYVILTEDGQRLLDLRKDFLSQRLADAYLGFAKSNASHFDRQSEEKKPKAARHFKRLNLAARHAWSEGELKVRLTEEEKATVYQFAEDVAQDTNLFYREDEALKEFFASTSTPLPEQPRLDRAEAFLQDLRKRHLY